MSRTGEATRLSVPDLGEPSGLTIVLPAEPDSVGRARRVVRELARRWGASEQAAADITLAVSEACTNVVIHAYESDESGDLHVTAERAAEGMIVSVADEGRGMAARVDSPGLGLGLPTIAALASRFEVRRGPLGRGTTLRMRFGLSSAREETSSGMEVDLI